MKKFLSFLLIAGIVATTYAPATMHACSCLARAYSQQEKLDATSTVFLGTVTSITETEMQNTVTLDVSAYWKGPVMKTKTVTTAKDSAACGYNFEVGVKYLVYTNSSEGKNTVGLCGFTQTANDASIAAMGTALIPNTIPGGPVTTVKFDTNLSYGMRGESVRLLQQYLNAHGVAVALSGAGSAGLETTYFGPATRAAVARFQAGNGITPAVGYFGPITRAYINK